METYLGTFFNVAAPRAEQVHLLDIATALGNTCRFGGHVSRFYSVAEHACLVYTLLKDHLGAPADLCLAGLHHDSHEAYVGDVPTPVKRLLGVQFGVLSVLMDYAIGERFNIMPGLFVHPLVKEADALALRVEAQTFKVSRGIGEHWGQTEPCVVPVAPVGLMPQRAAGYFERCHVEATYRADREIPGTVAW